MPYGYYTLRKKNTGVHPFPENFLGLTIEYMAISSERWPKKIQ